jgi:hypothetical protein
MLDDNLAVPAPTHGCHGARSLAGGATQLPITVSRSGLAAAYFVQVCINGTGSYPFLIDSGADSTTLSQSLVDQLHLPSAGPADEAAGVGCTVTTKPIHLDQWNVAGLSLSSQVAYAQDIPGFGDPGEPYGLLGADVLSRFGAIRFNFAGQTLLLAGPEQPGPTTETTQTGPLPTHPTPPSLVTPGPSETIGLQVQAGPGYAVAIARVEFPHSASHQFVLDTGSARSLADSSISADLPSLAESESISTACTTINATLVASGPWSADGVPLARVSIISTPFTEPVGDTTITGTLGADVLTSYRYATIDFAGARLVLGPRT